MPGMNALHLDYLQSMNKPPVVLFFTSPAYEVNVVNVTSVLYAHVNENRRIIYSSESSSALTMNFNKLWCQALNERKGMGVTHFLMLHADVRPLDRDWLDVMFEEMEKNDADVLSSIIPIKNNMGVTSTALDPKIEGVWSGVRLTQKQVLDPAMPDTWTADNLLVNTGLMLVDFRKPWVEKICFNVQNRIEKNEAGFYAPIFEPEDWNFSRQCHKLGVKLFVTRKVVVDHYGIHIYRSDEIWGADTDPQSSIKPDLSVVEA